MCGGIRRRQFAALLHKGLSPRVRGNHSGVPVRNWHRRSIPACAGESVIRRCLACTSQVYPRVCGGIAPIAVIRIAMGGLSPRVRGNPFPASGRCDDVRSIPACAGESDPGTVRRGIVQVYPRVCGGIRRVADQSLPHQGLSPRVRGNQRNASRTCPHRGSIPACAGESASAPPASGRRRVYPRVCGGINHRLSGPCSNRGLSPRVRGNRFAISAQLRRGRSIPACAGESAGLRLIPKPPPVYPRVCGGIRPGASGGVGIAGLSPRVRGNLGRAGAPGCGIGSIPACAGESPPGRTRWRW